MGTEMAGGGTLTPVALRAAENGVRRLLKLVGALADSAGPVEPAPPTKLMEVRGPDYYVYAPDSGFFEPLVELGDEVKKGQKAGLIHFPDTPWREPSTALFLHEGTVICKRMPCLTQRGDCLFHLGTPLQA
jgi:hypothetical protein